MARKNIFEILAEKQDFRTDAVRIDRLFSSEDIVVLGSINFNLKNYVRFYCFDDWKNKNHCIDLYDFLNTIA